MRDGVRDAAGKSSTTIILVGFMGAGKTSVGRALGQRLNWIFEDLDDRIVRREGRTIPEIFRDSGESEFRRIEHEALRDLVCELAGNSRIVALGGGAFAQEKNTALLSALRLPVLFLDAPVEELWERCCLQASQAGIERPLLRRLEEFRKLYDERRRSYTKAVFTIQTSDRSVDEIAAEIVQTLGLEAIPIRIEQGEVE